MASNMIWSHQIVHYLTHNKFNINIFIIGIILSLFFIILLRTQLFVSGKEWLRRMIGHHSTAITTTNQLLNKENLKENDLLYRLAKNIIYNQELEIIFMKSFL
jgi:hypothetical protein